MSQIEAQEGRALFTTPEQDSVIETLAEPLEDDRPISVIDTGIVPEGRKTHLWYMDSRIQGVAIFIVVSIVGLIVHKILFGGGTPKIVVAGEAQQIADLKQRLSQYEDNDEAKLKENASLTQGAQFESIPMDGQQNPKKDGATLANNPRPGTVSTNPRANPQPSPSTPARRPVTSRNSRPRYTSPPRPLSSYRPAVVAAKPRTQLRAEPKPTLDNCVEFVQGGINVPACAKHRISVKKEPAAKPITLGQAPTPTVPRPTKPIKLTPYKRPTLTAYAKPKAPKAKPSHQVNFLAGEIQTIDQYEQEFYGSGPSSQSTTPKVSKMSAKVVRHVEWRSQDEAQRVVIPLTITSGPHKNQSAEAKITSLNGTQFTAELTKIGNENVKPGQYTVEQKNTKYLLAQHKSQGGSNFGKQILGAALAVGGEVASDQLANVRGGSHISNLVPRGGQQQGASGQYWKFSGSVDIVAKS